MYHQYNIPQFCFCPHCIYVFCIYLRTNRDLCYLRHKLIGFYNRDEKCLQRGKDWGFKLRSVWCFVFKGLMDDMKRNMSSLVKYHVVYLLWLEKSYFGCSQNLLELWHHMLEYTNSFFQNTFFLNPIAFYVHVLEVKTSVCS